MRGKPAPVAPAGPFAPGLFLRQLEASRRARSVAEKGSPVPPSPARSAASGEHAAHAAAPTSLQDFVAEMVKAHLEQLARADSSCISDARLARLQAREDELAGGVAQLGTALRDELAELRAEVGREARGVREAVEQLESKVNVVATRQGSDEARNHIEQEKWSAMLAQLQAQLAAQAEEVRSLHTGPGATLGEEMGVSLGRSARGGDSKLLEASDTLKSLQEGLSEIAAWRAEVGRVRQRERAQAEQERQAARARAGQRRAVLGLRLEDDLDDEDGAAVSLAGPLAALQEKVSGLEAALKQPRPNVAPEPGLGKQVVELGQTCGALQRSLGAVQQRLAKLEARRPREEDEDGAQLEGLRRCLEDHGGVHTELRGSVLALGKRLAWLETHLTTTEETLHALRADAERDRLETKQVDLRVDGLEQRLRHSAEEAARGNVRIGTLQERVGALHTTVKSLAAMQASPEATAGIAEQLRREESALVEARDQQARLHQHMLAQHATEQQRYLEVLAKHQQQLDTILRLHEDEAAERARHREESFDASILRPQEPPAPVVNRRQDVPHLPTAPPATSPLREAPAAQPVAPSGRPSVPSDPQRTPPPPPPPQRPSTSDSPAASPAGARPRAPAAAAPPGQRTPSSSSGGSSRRASSSAAEEGPIGRPTQPPPPPARPERPAPPPAPPLTRDSSSEGEDDGPLSDCDLPMDDDEPRRAPTQRWDSTPKTHPPPPPGGGRAPTLTAATPAKLAALDDSDSDITIPTDEDSDDGGHVHRKARASHSKPTARPVPSRPKDDSSDED